MRGHERFRDRLASEAGIEAKLRMALVELDRDPHNFSTRPCSTCDPIAELLGEPFGCVRYGRTGRQSRLDGADT